MIGRVLAQKHGAFFWECQQGRLSRPKHGHEEDDDESAKGGLQIGAIAQIGCANIEKDRADERRQETRQTEARTQGRRVACQIANLPCKEQFRLRDESGRLGVAVIDVVARVMTRNGHAQRILVFIGDKGFSHVAFVLWEEAVLIQFGNFDRLRDTVYYCA